MQGGVDRGRGIDRGRRLGDPKGRERGGQNVRGQRGFGGRSVRRCQLFDAPDQGRLVDQFVPRGIGGDQRAIQRTALGRGELLGHRLMQHLAVEFVQHGGDAVAESVPARARRPGAAQQPAQGFAFAGIAVPEGGAVLSPLGFVQDGAQQQGRGMGEGTNAGIGLPKGVQVESPDGLLDASGEMLVGKALGQFEPSGVVVVPGRGSKTRVRTGRGRGGG